MTVTFGMIFVGGLLIYGGWTNRSVWALARGDNATPKAAVSTSGGITGPVTATGPTRG